MDVRNLANNLLNRSFEQKIPITNMKLLKLLYFVYKKYLQDFSKSLFADRFETWDYGPVMPNIYQEFKKYGSSPIQDYFLDTSGNAFGIEETPPIKDTIDYVWAKYIGKTGVELSEITHREGSAWRKAWDEHRAFLSDEDIRADTNE